jgi:hypothetical protein
MISLFTLLEDDPPKYKVGQKLRPTRSTSYVTVVAIREVSIVLKYGEKDGLILSWQKEVVDQNYEPFE